MAYYHHFVKHHFYFILFSFYFPTDSISDPFVTHHKSFIWSETKANKWHFPYEVITIQFLLPPLFFNFLIYYLKSIYPCEAMRYSPIFPELLRGALFYANTTINRNLNVVKHIDSEVSLQVEVQLYHLTQII